MDGLTSAPVNPAPASAPAPAPAAPAAAPAPAPAMSTPSTGMGGKISDIFKRGNMIELGFGIIGAAALYFTIYYYRYQMTMSKSLSSELQNKLDDLEIKVGDLQSALDRKSSDSGQTFL